MRCIKYIHITSYHFIGITLLFLRRPGYLDEGVLAVALHHGLHELVDEVVVLGARDALVPQPNVVLVVQQALRHGEGESVSILRLETSEDKKDRMDDKGLNRLKGPTLRASTTGKMKLYGIKLQISRRTNSSAFHRVIRQSFPFTTKDKSPQCVWDTITTIRQLLVHCSSSEHLSQTVQAAAAAPVRGPSRPRRPAERHCRVPRNVGRSGK